MSTVSNLETIIKNLWPFAKQASSIPPWVVTVDAIALLELEGEAPVLMDAPSLIVPRKHLFYQCIDLDSVPQSLRTNLVQQRVRLFSPFTNPACWLVMEGDLAQAWFWDADRLNTYINQQDQALTHLAIVPEIALYAPCENGLRVQPCLEGWELQYWQAQVLRHSRWLAVLPSERDKRDFMRVCGANDDDVWQETTRELLPKPWNQKAFWSKENLTSEAVAPRLVLAALLFFLVLQVGLGLGSQVKEYFLASSVAHKTKQLKSLVQQRDAALQQQEFNQSVLKLIDNPSQLHLLAEVRSCLAPFSFVILDWQYQRDQLVLLLQQDNLDTRALIEACSKSASFSAVHAEPGITPNQTRLLLSLPAADAKKGDDNA